MAATLALAAAFVLGAGPAGAAYQPGIPPAVDPGTPTFRGLADPVPAEPAAYDPEKSMLQAIYDADLAAGGTSFWVDRILARPFLNNSDSTLFTRGRALYMKTHQPATLGFAASGNGQGSQGGGYAYRQPPSGRTQDLYTISVSGGPLTEDTAQRMQYPSYFSGAYRRADLSVAEKKFITYNNVAVTDLTLTNTGTSPLTTTLTASSPITNTPASGGTELTGTVTARFGLTTLFPRMSGDGFMVSGTALTRDVTLDPGGSVSLKVQLGVITSELSDSAPEYERYRGYDPDTAWLTQMREYNKFWVDNVPYIDIPDRNIDKMSYYRTFLNRYNYFDGDIPGNDFQFPVDIEGVLGYNNPIQLTVPMRMQDLKYWRNPLYSYGPWVSSGESSKCTAFTDNPGDTDHWNNNHEQYIGREAWQSYQVHGGEPAILNNLAHYSECDVKGQLAKFDANGNDLVEYASGFYTGNDADAVALAYANPTPPGRNAIARAEDRAESAFWYSGAQAAAQEYATLGDAAKSAEMNSIAGRIKNAILTNLWDDRPVDAPGGGHVFKQKDVQTGELIPWKDQQNFSPFTEGVPPDTDDYKLALRYYADKAEFPIMPSYTANQNDKAAARAAGRGGSNNFSNINSTLQAQLYSAAIRNYPSPYITPDMYRKLIEWQSWTEYINGDNRFPDNNEYWSNYNPATQTLTRSAIHHNVLGAYNFMLIEDVAGMRPRSDDVVELWPIDMGYDHFTVNNLSYHGSDLTIVWQRPGGTRYYPNAPEGYSLYFAGRHAFTVDDLAHVTWDPASGTVQVLDGSSTQVLSSTTAAAKKATDVSQSANARVVDIFAKAGVDLTGAPGSRLDLAAGKTASASFTAPDTTESNAVDGFTISGPTVAPGSYVMTPGYSALNPIWGTKGSPNGADWYAVDLGKPTRLNDVKLYFYSNKNFGAGPPQGPAVEGNTYREPAAYTVQYYDGSIWRDVPGQVRSPAIAAPNYNDVAFPPVVAQQFRVLMTPQAGYGIGLKEMQAFDLESVPDVVDSVEAYIHGLPLSPGLDRSLTVKLTQALDRYREARKTEAVNIVDAFRHQVDDLRSDGILTADQAAVLTASATAIITHIRE